MVNALLPLSAGSWRQSQTFKNICALHFEMTELLQDFQHTYSCVSMCTHNEGEGP